MFLNSMDKNIYMVDMSPISSEIYAYYYCCEITKNMTALECKITNYIVRQCNFPIILCWLPSELTM